MKKILFFSFLSFVFLGISLIISPTINKAQAITCTYTSGTTCKSFSSSFSSTSSCLTSGCTTATAAQDQCYAAGCTTCNQSPGICTNTSTGSSCQASSYGCGCPVYTSGSCPNTICQGTTLLSGVSCTGSSSNSSNYCSYSTSTPNSSSCGGGGTCTAGTGSTTASCGGVAGYQCQGASTCEELTYRCSGSSCVVGSHIGVSQSFCCSGGQVCSNGSCSSGTGCSAGLTNPYSTCSSGACVSVAACGSSTCSTSADCTAPPPSAVCGDGACNGSETCSTCSTDCGTCPVTTYSISGNVFIDTNANGSKDTGEANYTGATITLSTGATTTSNTSGNYTFSSLAAGTYTVTITTPSGYVATTTNPAPKTLGPSTTANFGMQQVPTYTVSGSVFVDDNKNQVQDGAEANYSGGITISSKNTTTGQNAGNVTYPNPASSGTYLISGLAAGTYTISYSLPSGYQLSYPLNGPPPSFNITVGPGCSVGGSNSASCN